MSENKFFKYIVYAIGEIILVVIGILIALYINNRNDATKERVNEIRYLTNLRKDVVINVAEIDKYITMRTEAIKAAKVIIDHFEGKPIQDAPAFFEMGLPIYNWQRFYQNNNTFQELTSSGNLTLITNDSIKTLLYDLESIYKINKAEEDHFRFDTEVLIYEPIYEIVDLKVALQGIGIPMSDSKSNSQITPATFTSFLKNIKLKNGFAMTILEFSTLNEQLSEMKKMSQLLIQVIDREIKKDK